MRKKLRESGAIAIESVISLTFFMIGVLAIMMISMVVSTECKMQYALDQTAKEISGYYYLIDKTGLTQKLAQYKNDVETNLGGVNDVVHDVNDLINDTDGVISNVVSLADDTQGSYESIRDSVVSGDFETAVNTAVDFSEYFPGEAYKIGDQTSELLGKAIDICDKVDDLMSEDNLKGITIDIVRLFALSYVEQSVSNIITERISPVLMTRYLTDGSIKDFYKKVGIVPESVHFYGSELLPDGRSIKLVMSYKMNLGKLTLGITNKEVAFTHSAATAAWARPVEGGYIKSLTDVSKMLRGEEPSPPDRHLPEVTTVASDDSEEPAETTTVTTEDPAVTTTVTTEDPAVTTTTKEELEAKIALAKKVSEYTPSESDVKRIQAKGDVKLKNANLTYEGKELNEDEKVANDMFRGDQFTAANSYNNSIEPSLRKKYIDVNSSSTCEYNFGLDNKMNTNDSIIFRENMSEEDKKTLAEIEKMRGNVEPVQKDTVMQKVITEDDAIKYVLADDRHKPNAYGCVAKASDAAPYTSNINQAYESLRLDYDTSPYFNDVKGEGEKSGDMFVIRFITKDPPSNESLPENPPPCSQTGYTASKNYLIPEYKYSGQVMLGAAIFKIDENGNEYLFAYLNDKNEFVEAGY